MNELRPDFRAADRPDRHDEAEPQIDVAERAVPFRRHDRFADDVGQIGPDGEIPIQPDRAQGRPRDKTSAHAKEAAQNADEKPDHDEIDRD